MIGRYGATGGEKETRRVKTTARRSKLKAHMQYGVVNVSATDWLLARFSYFIFTKTGKASTSEKENGRPDAEPQSRTLLTRRDVRSRAVGGLV